MAKFSLTTSEISISRARMSFALSVRRFSVMPNLPALWLLKAPPMSMPRRSSIYGGVPRRMSQRPWRTGSSMRITSAPNDASHLVAPAPASWPVKSQMRKGDSACVPGVGDAAAESVSVMASPTWLMRVSPLTRLAARAGMATMATLTHPCALPAKRAAPKG